MPKKAKKVLKFKVRWKEEIYFLKPPLKPFPLLLPKTPQPQGGERAPTKTNTMVLTLSLSRSRLLLHHPKPALQLHFRKMGKSHFTKTTTTTTTTTCLCFLKFIFWVLIAMLSQGFPYHKDGVRLRPSSLCLQRKLSRGQWLQNQKWRSEVFTKPTNSFYYY